MKEGSLSLVFDPREFCSYGGDSSAGSTISTAISKPPTNFTSSTGSTSSTGDESSGGSNWSASQPVQFNVANAQDELEINFRYFSFFVHIEFSGCFSILVTDYGSGYDLCCVPALVFHGCITFVCSPVSMELLHIKGGVFRSEG